MVQCKKTCYLHLQGLFQLSTSIFKEVDNGSVQEDLLKIGKNGVNSQLDV